MCYTTIQDNGRTLGFIPDCQKSNDKAIDD